MGKVKRFLCPKIWFYMVFVFDIANFEKKNKKELFGFDGDIIGN